jgi:hypothetical protein
MYVMLCTRLDVSHAIGGVGREHWEAVKWVLRYFKGTRAYCITYNGCSDSVFGYVDSDFVGDLDKRRSTSCYFFTLAGGSICWMSKLKKIVSLSTTKENYIVVSLVCKDEILLKGLLGEFGKMQDKVNVFYDSQSVIHLAVNLAYLSKAKHIDIKFHFVRHDIDGGGIALKKFHTQENCSNMFTKLLLLENLRWCLASLGMQKKVMNWLGQGIK